MLNKITSADSGVVMDPASNCASPLYQSSTLSVSAVLTRVSTDSRKSSVTTPRVDLTSLFAFEVTGGDRKAVALSEHGGVVRGIRPTGTSAVKVGCKGSGACGVAFVVSDAVQSISRLSASVLNKVSIGNTFNSGVPFESTSPFQISVVAENVLDSEGDTAQVFASVKMSDGAYMSMTEADLNVTSSVLSVTKRTTLTVPIGATKTEGCGLVAVT